VSSTKAQEPPREAVWNDLEEMYSFDLEKVEDMILKGRRDSAAAGAKDLEEQYSFDLAKVEDLVTKSRLEASELEEEDPAEGAALGGMD